MVKEVFTCKYCKKKMNKFDFKINKGYCGKCSEVMDWKNILSEYKEFNKQFLFNEQVTTLEKKYL